MATLNPVQFYAPLVNPSPQGLWANTLWQTDGTAPARFLSGVQIRPQNFDGTTSSGVWGADWCADLDELTPDDLKTGSRAAIPLPFDAVTIWAFDQCDMTPASRAETKARAQQTLRLNEQQHFEREFTGRLNADTTLAGGVALSTSDFVDAVGKLEELIADAGQQGFIHAPTKLAARAANAQLLVKTGTGFQTPFGSRWVFGSYAVGLNGNMVATSQPFGWRDEVQVRETLKTKWNEHITVAERSAVVGYEHLFGAVKYNHTPAP